MAFYLGSTKIVDTSASPGVFPLPVASGLDRGAALYNNGANGFFAYPGNTNSVVGSGFELRSIFTHGFMCGGYKNSNPWRSVHKTWHATDVTYSVGEQLQLPVAYTDSLFSDYNGYVFGVTTGFQGSSAVTSSINLHTGLSRNRISGLNTAVNAGGLQGMFGTSDGTVPYGYGSSDTSTVVAGQTAPPAGGMVGDDNPTQQGITYGVVAAQSTTTTIWTASGVGGWNMQVERDACGGAVNQIGQEGYVTGGGSSTTSRMHFGTEIMYAGSDSGMAGNFATGAHGETRAYFNVAGTKKYLTYSTQIWATYTGTQGTDGQAKFLSTKKGWHYIGQGTNTSSQYITKMAESNGSDLTTTIDRGFNAGEENHQMGQEWGYCLGQYDGQQNNKSHKMTYSNDTVTTLGSAARPKGHYGMSSAGGMSAAASITSAYAV